MDEPKSFLPAVVDAGRVIKHRRPRRMAQLTESERRIAATWARLVGFTERKHVDYVMLESEVERRYGIKVTQPELKFLSTSPRFRRYLTRMVTSSREVVRERLLPYGALISEWDDTHPTESWHFPVRNRIISGL